MMDETCEERLQHEGFPGRAWACLALVALLVLACSGPADAQGLARTKLVFSCQPRNDLFTLLSSRGGKWMRFDTPQEAVRYAPHGAGVLILADGYPDDPVEFSDDIFDQAAAKGLRTYVEFPRHAVGMAMDAPRQALWERVVITSRFFEPALPPWRVLSVHQCTYVPIETTNADLMLSRVAGFDSAIFGLPERVHPRLPTCKTFPILVRSPLGEIMVASTKLSNFSTGRFAPAEEWRVLWQRILEWLSGEKVAMPMWPQLVGPTFVASDPLPVNGEAQALRKGAQWYFNARLFVHPAWREKLKVSAANPDQIAPPLDLEWPVGDGKLGLLEGFASRIGDDGRQFVRCWLRNDNMSEAAMALAFDAVTQGTAKSAEAAGNLVDFIYGESQLAKGPRSDPKSPSYGLVGWNTDSGLGVYYGDDNARGMLGVMAAAALLKTDRWDEALMRCLLGNLRTTGSLGFRYFRVEEPVLHTSGWQDFFLAPVVHLSPHYQAYLWAAYLWAYKQTGYAPFLERTKAAIQTTMGAYPDKWRWTNGIQQERARMLLPLAWLVRVEDTPEHRQWLRRIADDLLASQDASGAIPEQLGPPGMGDYPPPKSNDEYGANEAPVIQENGNPVCDLLYTTNFALLGLHEAAAATADPAYANAESKLTGFLCRIQTRSEELAELDGAWYRAFDFKRWEYWGCDSDSGWGAWSIETGWTQGWIVSVLGLQQLKTSFWDLTANTAIKKHLDALVPVMMAGAFDPIPADEKIAHLAVGKPVTLANPYVMPYAGGGNTALTDGRIGKAGLTHPAWQGFLAVDLDATIDLGAAAPIKHLQSQFLHFPGGGALTPANVEYATSQDGTTFTVVATVANEIPVNTPGPLIKSFAADVPEAAARYIRVRAKNAGVIPEGFPEQGKPSRVMSDEIVVQ